MPDKLPGELGVAVVQEPCCRDGIRLFVAALKISHAADVATGSRCTR